MRVVERRRRYRDVHLPRRGSIVDLRGKCYKCFSASHLVDSCRRPTRCFRCFKFGHQAARCSSLPEAGGRRCGSVWVLEMSEFQCGRGYLLWTIPLHRWACVHPFSTRPQCGEGSPCHKTPQWWAEDRRTTCIWLSGI